MRLTLMLMHFYFTTTSLTHIFTLFEFLIFYSATIEAMTCEHVIFWTISNDDVNFLLTREIFINKFEIPFDIFSSIDFMALYHH